MEAVQKKSRIGLILLGFVLLIALVMLVLYLKNKKFLSKGSETLAAPPVAASVSEIMKTPPPPPTQTTSAPVASTPPSAPPFVASAGVGIVKQEAPPYVPPAMTVSNNIPANNGSGLNINPVVKTPLAQIVTKPTSGPLPGVIKTATQTSTTLATSGRG